MSMPAAWRVDSYLDDDDAAGNDFAALRNHRLSFVKEPSANDNMARKDALDDLMVSCVDARTAKILGVQQAGLQPSRTDGAHRFFYDSTPTRCVTSVCNGSCAVGTNKSVCLPLQVQDPLAAQGKVFSKTKHKEAKRGSKWAGRSIT